MFASLMARIFFQLCIWFAVASNLITATADDQSIDQKRRERQNDRPICVVKYGPYNGVFLLDTGATRTFAWDPPELVEAPDKSWKVVDDEFLFASGKVSAKLISGIPISVFGRQAVASQMSYRRNDQRNPYRQLQGIVGVQDLLDFPFRICLNNAICEPLERDASFSSSIPIFMDRFNVPTIQIELPAFGSTSVVLDTGLCWFMAIPDDKIESFVRSGIAKHAGNIEASNSVGLHPVKSYILREVTVGNYVFQNVEAVTWPHNRIGLGCDFFRHFDCGFDFPERQLGLTPESDTWPKTVAPDASGVVFEFDENDNLAIVRLHSRNVETTKVLQPNDVITVFDGKPPSEYSYLRIMNRLSQAGTSVPLRIRRDGKEMDLDLKLMYPYEYPPTWGDIVEINDEVRAFDKFLRDQAKKQKERQKRSLPPAGSEKP